MKRRIDNVLSETTHNISPDMDGIGKYCNQYQKIRCSGEEELTPRLNGYVHDGLHSDDSLIVLHDATSERKTSVHSTVRQKTTAEEPKGRSE